MMVDCCGKSDKTIFSKDYSRYQRQMILDEIGVAGQERLRAAKVLTIGVGGLGCPAALYLAAAGIGTLGIVECDHVDLSNLHRQTLYTTKDVGQPKCQVAEQRLRALNPDIRIDCFEERLSAENAITIINGYDIVLDGND